MRVFWDNGKIISVNNYWGKYSGKGEFKLWSYLVCLNGAMWCHVSIECFTYQALQLFRTCCHKQKHFIKQIFIRSYENNSQFVGFPVNIKKLQNDGWNTDYWHERTNCCRFTTLLPLHILFVIHLRRWILVFYGNLK